MGADRRIRGGSDPAALRDLWKEWKQKPKRKRQLHPRTPEDCPFCQAYEPEWPTRSRAVRPWGEVKSRAGHPKLYDSEGYWCDNPACEYYGITEAGIHALVSDGWPVQRLLQRPMPAF